MPVIDLSFVLVGSTIPLDHGYALFSSLCRIVPELHGDTTIGVHPIRGRQTAPGVLSLTERSRLKIRLPAENVAPYIAIAGKEIELDGHRLQVGIPQVEGLVPAESLASRLVTFRNALTPESLLDHVRGELDRMRIAARPELVPATRAKFAGQPIRRVLMVKDKRVVGFALRVFELSPDASLQLQGHGMGGRRRMACGLFCPWEPAKGAVC
jgi:CRISPR-associated protein Cas6